MAVEITTERARQILVGHLGLDRVQGRGVDGARRVLDQLNAIQLDPLDTIGTNADLVAMARVDDLIRGEVYDAVLPGEAFEHFAKERCLLPARAFPYYRDQAVQTPWWRHSQRMKKLDEGLLDAVLAEVRDRGPVATHELSDHGRVTPIDWSGWKGTGKAGTLALEVLWTRCQIVVCGRLPQGKVYDVPERALTDVYDHDVETDFDRWALLQRVASAGLLCRAGGPMWSMLRDVRTGGLVDDLLDDGTLVEVRVEGSRRPYLSTAEILGATADPDGRMRILGPLDPLIWDRKLTHHAFDFEYVWEVYKPAAKRRWGYYVCPLLLGDRLVGRVEGHVEDGELVCDTLWEEDGFDRQAFDAAWNQHAGRLKREEGKS